MRTLCLLSLRLKLAVAGISGKRDMSQQCRKEAQVLAVACLPLAIRCTSASKMRAAIANAEVAKDDELLLGV
eukprot:7795255-Prorocentrum_lima.AAC.1